MSDKFNEQKTELESLYKEIKLLAQQVRYLLKNERTMDLLDVEVMMNRTHGIYDKICAISAVSREGEEWEDDLFWEKDANTPSSAKEQEETKEEVEETAQLAEEEESAKAEEEATDFGFIFRPEEVGEEENKVGELGELSEEEDKVGEESELKEEEKEEEEAEEELRFDFNISAGEIEEPEIENDEEKRVGELGELSEEEKEIYTTGDQIEMVIPHFEIEVEEDQGEEELQEEEEEEKQKEEERGQVEMEEQEEVTEEQEEVTEEQEEVTEEQEEVTEEQEEVTEEQEEVVEEQEDVMEEQEEVVEEQGDVMEEPRRQNEEKTKEQTEEDYFPYEPVLFGDVEEKEDAGFELAQETLGDRFQEEDHSLAAKLQHKPVRDLRTAIGINDKFLLVNELFGGNMERYNKSIENLNDLPTLVGALGYMDELYVQYQWNRNNEAYKKLMDLVQRKFEG